MNELTKEDIQEMLDKAIAYTPRQSSIDDDTHKTHHKFVGLQIQRAERSAKRIETFKQSIIGTIAAAVVGGFLWVGKVVLDVFKHGS